MEGKVVALMAIDFITQLALTGDFTRISYFVVDAAVRNTGIGGNGKLLHEVGDEEWK